MTIRSGGRPRDRRAAAPATYDPDAYATESIPEYSEPVPRRGGGGWRRRRGTGLTGFLKFLIFALVLAAVVLSVGLTVLRPVVGTVVMDIASDNPATLQLPFVKDIVAENLGDALTQPVASEPTQVEFLVESGDTARTVAEHLETEGLIRDSRAFIYIATVRDLTGDLQQGTFVLRKNMTPDQLVSARSRHPWSSTWTSACGPGCASSRSRPSSRRSRSRWTPPSSTTCQVAAGRLVNDYPWLKTILATAPKSASLEGFLWPATYRVLPDTTPEELVRLMLDKFALNVGPERMTVPAARGLSFYQILTLASIVEREAQLPDEKPLIAGVYANRLDPTKWETGLLQSDPTIFYVHDSLELTQIPVTDWKTYSFWAPIDGGLTTDALPEDLAGYNTYTSKGLPPGPICTPTITSIDAALSRTRRTATCTSSPRATAPARAPSRRRSRSTRRTRRST